MKTQPENTKPEKVKAILAKNGLLNKDKPTAGLAKTDANPNSIFVVVGILLVATIIYLAINK